MGFRELLKKYGPVGVGVHLSVSAASFTGLYVAIRNNVDVEFIIQRVRFSSPSPNADDGAREFGGDGDRVLSDDPATTSEQRGESKRSRTAELAGSSGGAFVLALLCNKVLLPVRLPVTIALTPTVAKFLSRWNLLKNHLR